jgi:predicted transcriptional regulator
MDAAIAHLAWETRADKSVIVRQAICEYFERRGVNALTGI